ncbi:spore coat protein [Sediminibacillus massiliensis]|uniref:spore coat protein n=1 Tax=Sediminibacillus massiliensis TaxID=1926277 RepID=UPI0009884989|nr:spore coat protein [Sediminibacillus massiliensis]
MRRHHGPHHGCMKPANQIVYPTKHNVVHNCYEENVQHVHPSHTTVMNHHLIKNNHVYPHSTSVQNTVDSVDLYGGSFNVPGNQVAGAATPPFGPGSQVAGASTSPYGPGSQVAGAMSPGGPGMGPYGPKGWKKNKKWC